MSFKTTDNKTVTVQLPPGNLEMPEGIIELRGTVVNEDTLNCEEIIKFPMEPQDFGNIQVAR
jgi:hypothetical protein